MAVTDFNSGLFYIYIMEGTKMTVIDQIEDSITDKAGTLVWSAALVAALGDPKNWEFTGDCVQGDPSKTHCACGHPIMDCYIIRHKVTGRNSMLGSTCIDYFEQAGEIYGHLVVALANQEKKLAEAKKAAKRAADEIKVAEARAAYESRYDTLLARFKAYREMGRMAPRELWSAMASHYRVHRAAPEYQRPCDYLKWYAKQTAALANL
jgi:hypothetical protein